MHGLIKQILPAFCLVVLAAPTQAQPAFNADQLLTDVRVLAADSLEGRRTETEGSRKAQAYLLEAFAASGLRAFGDDYRQPFTFRYGRGATEARGVNLIGYVEGSEHPDSFIVLTAHYDHLGKRGGKIYNGADDNASGTAGLLAAARHFAQQPPLHSIIFAVLDAEEMGLQGARAFLETPPVPLEQIHLNVNLDMISRNEAGELYAAGTYHYPFLKPYLADVGAQSTVDLRFGHDQPDLPSGDDWTMSSDHGPFHQAGIPFVYFGVEDHPGYHKPTDDYEDITPAFFADAVQLVIAALTDLDANLEAIHAATADQAR